MELLETYEELIEADSRRISICWKIFQISFYLFGVISGYGVSILFHILWYDVFAGNCPLWAHIISPIQPRVMSDEVPVGQARVIVPDWRQKIIVTFKYTAHCKVYHFVSLSSCAFGIAWMILFAMCGKGGYDTRIFVAPWTVVPPAIIFQFIFAIIVMFVVHDMEYGYSKFANSLQRVTSVMNEPQLMNLTRQCDVLQSYLELFGRNNWDVCKIHSALQVLSWIMAWSWILGLITLIFRIVRVNDFKLLTVSIYKPSPKEVEEYSQQIESSESTESM